MVNKASCSSLVPRLESAAEDLVFCIYSVYAERTVPPGCPKPSQARELQETGHREITL